MIHRINLNDQIKVKLTDLGKEIYYHRFDATNQIAGREVCKPCFPKEDEDGYTKFQLWDFIRLYGPHIDMILPNVVLPLEMLWEEAEPSAQPEKRTEKHTESHGVCLDVIDRQAAIDHLKKRLYETALNNVSDADLYQEIADNRIDIWVNEMPSAQSERWIPVTERLPEEDGEYLVANLTIKGKPCVYGIDTFANDLYQVDKYDFSDKKGKRGWVYFHDEYGYLEDKTVVAWMPLPEAYKGEGRDDG